MPSAVTFRPVPIGRTPKVFVTSSQMTGSNFLHLLLLRVILDNLSLCPVTRGHESNIFPIGPLVLHPIFPCVWHLTWEIRAVPEAPSKRDLHCGPGPRTETRGRIRSAACCRFSKAAAAAAQRQERIASSAILNKARGTESRGLWDAGGRNSTPSVPSPLPLALPGPQTGNGFPRKVHGL